jgi:hypothetical protein
MNFSSLSASDKRTLVLGAIVAVAGILSFMDPSGSWGVIVVIGILGGLLAVYVAIQPQMAPSMKLPATKGMLLLVAGAAAALGFVVAGLTYFGYVLEVTRVFSIIFDIGLVASIVLLWFAWLAYQAEPKAVAPPAPPATPAPPAPPAA